jgi:RNA polymerase sigma-70 factor (ECF subfamily)
MESEQKRIYLLCFRMLGNEDDAGTAAQDVFFKAYRALEREGAETPEEPARWLTRIAVNTCLDRLRSRRWRFWKQRPSQEDEELILAMARSSGPSPETALFSKEIMDRLGQALSRLSLRQRSIFVLKHYEDRTIEEIGAILNLETGTVKAHMARAVARLRVELKDLYERSTLAGR